MILIELLDELTMHCKNVTGKDCDIQLLLPDAVIDDFYLNIAKPKELIQPGTPIETKMDSFKVYGHGGIVNVHKETSFVLITSKGLEY